VISIRAIGGFLPTSGCPNLGETEPGVPPGPRLQTDETGPLKVNILLPASYADNWRNDRPFELGSTQLIRHADFG
jgi:hypothetical protein